jgi:hypothetical protein
MLYHVCADLTPISPAVQCSSAGDIYHAMAFEVRQPLPAPQPPTPVMWLTTTPGPTPGATYAQARSYADPANRPAVTGTTRNFTSSATLTTALNAAVPGDLVKYAGTGVLTIPGFYTGLMQRRYSDYVNIDFGLVSSGNYVLFNGGGSGQPAVYVAGAQYMRIYGSEITNVSLGTAGLHIEGAAHSGDGSTNHITWYNAVIHDCRSDGIRMLPTLGFSGGTPSQADMTIADCDIEAEVYNIALDKTIDSHNVPGGEAGTGQHCCLVADSSPIGAANPQFLRNRVAIDGHDTGLVSTQGGSSVVEIGFPDSTSTISACTTPSTMATAADPMA